MTDHGASTTIKAITEAAPAIETSGGSPRVVLLVGVGAHSDPWHALTATSQRIVDVLKEHGYTDVRAVTTDDQADFINAVNEADVLIINASSDLSLEAPDSTALVDIITSHWHRQGGILASHSSTLAFRDDPRWAELLGGRWVPGITMHPQIGTALIQAAPHGIDIVTFDDFTVYDERYTHLETSTQAQVLAFHTEDGVTHPLIWAIDTDKGSGRVAYDALGHGVESYDSIEHQQVFLSLTQWVANTSTSTGQEGPP